ncbi:hypothetical protein SETIT_2G385200v2 [Setaria italica]|uniref:Sulfotransferase n=2 Tax=Setaria TaxID=4554 RepID=K3ZZM0_SETIT|nr:hypothetical protein SETIT_2G385200v2 [Setaria italica]TKW35755.1 hypothetical protein SEVIR_2G395600v2 [Setaria viridis]
MVMATSNEPDAVGPVPFKDIAGAVPLTTVSGYPSDPKLWQSFTPRRGDVVLASPPKCGTTWLKALAFATMARGVYPPVDAEPHPLVRLNPHDCVPFMEMLFAAGQGRSKMDALPSPRLMATHMHHSILPASIKDNADCKIIYICREPKDMVVSLWHFARRTQPDLLFSDTGPIWDHVLGYWNASKASPETVLFLRYDEMLRDPVGNVKKAARFVGQPFSPAEEEAGVVMDVVRLCSFETLRNLEINRAGEVGDWASYMTPDMARRLDAVVDEKLRGSGLSFA